MSFLLRRRITVFLSVGKREQHRKRFFSLSQIYEKKFKLFLRQISNRAYIFYVTGPNFLIKLMSYQINRSKLIMTAIHALVVFCTKSKGGLLAISNVAI